MTEHQRDIVAVLTHDHREVEHLFGQIEKLPPGDAERKSLSEQVILELVRHSVAEEQYLYPTARKFLDNGDEVADHEIEEHASAEKTMKAIEKCDVGDPELDRLLGELMAEVRHHIKEEEGDLFPRLVKAASQDELTELGAKVEAAKKAAPTRPHPSAPDTPPGNKLLGPGTGLVDRLRDALTGRGKS